MWGWRKNRESEKESLLLVHLLERQDEVIHSKSLSSLISHGIRPYHQPKKKKQSHNIRRKYLEFVVREYDIKVLSFCACREGYHHHQVGQGLGPPVCRGGASISKCCVCVCMYVWWGGREGD